MCRLSQATAGGRRSLLFRPWPTGCCSSTRKTNRTVRIPAFTIRRLNSFQTARLRANFGKRYSGSESGVSSHTAEIRYLHAFTPSGSTTRIGGICGFGGGKVIVSVIPYSAHEPFFLATASYLSVMTPGDRFSLIRLKCSFQPRISLIRHRSHRTPGMNVPPSPDFDLYASAISSFVGSLGCTWANAIMALIAAVNIRTGTESFTILSDVGFRLRVPLLIEGQFHILYTQTEYNGVVAEPSAVLDGSQEEAAHLDPAELAEHVRAKLNLAIRLACEANTNAVRAVGIQRKPTSGNGKT